MFVVVRRLLCVACNLLDVLYCFFFFCCVLFAVCFFLGCCRTLIACCLLFVVGRGLLVIA